MVGTGKTGPPFSDSKKKIDLDKNMLVQKRAMATWVLTIGQANGKTTISRAGPAGRETKIGSKKLFTQKHHEKNRNRYQTKAVLTL